MANDAAARIARRCWPYRVGDPQRINVIRAKHRIVCAKNLRRIHTPEELEVMLHDDDQTAEHGEARS